MKRPVFSILDTKAKVFGNPWNVVNVEVATRMFGHAITDSESDLSKSPRDFALYQLGLFDDVKGVIIAEEMPTLICTGHELLAEFKLEQETDGE
jgi:hypothetical protein